MIGSSEIWHKTGAQLQNRTLNHPRFCTGLQNRLFRQYIEEEECSKEKLVMQFLYRFALSQPQLTRLVSSNNSTLPMASNYSATSTGTIQYCLNSGVRHKGACSKASAPDMGWVYSFFFFAAKGGERLVRGGTTCMHFIVVVLLLAKLGNQQ